jgi:hypothetical protein
LKIISNALEKESKLAFFTNTKEEMARIEWAYAVSKLKVNNLSQDKFDLQDQPESYMSDLQQSHLRLSLSPTESLKAEVEANNLLASERERSEGLVVEKMSLETRQITLTVNAEIVSTVAVKEKLEKEIDLMTTNAAKLKAELEDTNFKVMNGAIISLRMDVDTQLKILQLSIERNSCSKIKRWSASTLLCLLSTWRSMVSRMMQRTQLKSRLPEKSKIGLCN